MPFGEYELSPSLIGLSLLHTPHREAFQRLSVRTSIPRYRDFILDMCRSLGFASATSNYNTACSASLSLRMPAIDGYPRWRRQLVGSLCKRHAVTCTRQAPTACRRMVSGTISLPSSGCFSPFPHGTRSLSVSREYLALPDGPGGFAQDYSCPALLRMPLGPVCVHVQDCHLL